MDRISKKDPQNNFAESSIASESELGHNIGKLTLGTNPLKVFSFHDPIPALATLYPCSEESTVQFFLASLQTCPTYTQTQGGLGGRRHPCTDLLMMALSMRTQLVTPNSPSLLRNGRGRLSCRLLSHLAELSELGA